MMERSKSLAPHTGKVFEVISHLKCIKPYTLVGGTALSLQIEKRQSDAALEHSSHKLRTRGLLAMLTNGSRFIKEKSFEELAPVYDVTPYDIQEYIKQKLLEKRETVV